MIKLLHISDLHFGPPYIKAAGDAILAQVATGAYAAVVATGDLTQRARVTQFVQAGAFLKSLESHARVIVIPGNHDIPLYRIWDRLMHPYRLFHTQVSKDRNPVLHLDDVTIIGLDSTHPLLRISNGRLGKTQLNFGKKALQEAHLQKYRAIALHHPLFLDPDFTGPDGILEMFLDWGVDLVFCGHAHSGLAQRVKDSRDRSLIISQCGTSTSSRGRGEGEGKNSINEIELSDSNIRVRLMEYNEGHFKAVREEIFPRNI